MVVVSHYCLSYGMTDTITVLGLSLEDHHKLVVRAIIDYLTQE